MVVLVHRFLGGDRRAVGRSMIVGIMIFNIVGGLDCGGGRSHEFVWRRLVWLGQCRPHRLRRLV